MRLKRTQDPCVCGWDSSGYGIVGISFSRKTHMAGWLKQGPGEGGGCFIKLTTGLNSIANGLGFVTKRDATMLTSHRRRLDSFIHALCEQISMYTYLHRYVPDAQWRRIWKWCDEAWPALRPSNLSPEWLETSLPCNPTPPTAVNQDFFNGIFSSNLNFLYIYIYIYSK
jgi:hypothetical protein